LRPVIDTSRLMSNVMTSPTGVEASGKGHVGHMRGQTIQSAANRQSQVAQASRKQLSARIISQMSLQRLLTLTKRAGLGKSEAAASRIADFYDTLPNMPDRARLASLIAEVRSFQEELKSEDIDSDDDEIEGDPEEDEDGVETADGESRKGAAKTAIGGFLEKFSSDVSDQAAALEIIVGEFEEDELDPDMQAALAELSQHFEEGNVGRDVRAGMAAARAAYAASATLGTDPAAIRDAYRAMIRQEMSFSKLFDALLQFDPLANSDTILETFCLAAGTDLTNLTGPSTDPTLLRALLGELGKLKKLRTVLDGCGKLVEDVESALSGEQKGLLAAPSLASRLLAFISRGSVSILDAMKLLGELARAKPGAKLIFFNGVEYLLVLVPDEMFPDMGARLSQKQALRKANEKVVDEEEDEFAEEGGLKKTKRKPGKAEGGHG
jgi:type III secretion system YopN/LcrE/InvE/MxiC family regulator